MTDTTNKASKAPVQTEPFPVPSNHCVRLHDQKRLRPLRSRSAQQNPEQSVGTAQVGPLSPAVCRQNPVREI